MVWKKNMWLRFELKNQRFWCLCDNNQIKTNVWWPMLKIQVFCEMANRVLKHGLQQQFGLQNQRFLHAFVIAIKLAILVKKTFNRHSLQYQRSLCKCDLKIWWPISKIAMLKKNVHPKIILISSFIPLNALHKRAKKILHQKTQRNSSISNHNPIRLVIPHFLTVLFPFYSASKFILPGYFPKFLRFYFAIFHQFFNILHVYISAFYLYALQTFYSSFLKLLSA